jgi:hypothetical protein
MERTMTQVEVLLTNTLDQLVVVIDGLTDADYVRPCRHLADESIGRHVRHIIDMFLCLENGYPSGVVCYEQRKRDPRPEQSAPFAIDLIREIKSKIHRPDMELLIIGAYAGERGNQIRIPTNYQRELLFLLEHTIHHMALIRIGCMDIGIQLLPESFGVAPATLQYRSKCAP